MRSCLIVSALDSGSSGSELKPRPEHNVVFPGVYQGKRDGETWYISSKFNFVLFATSLDKISVLDCALFRSSQSLSANQGVYLRYWCYLR